MKEFPLYSRSLMKNTSTEGIKIELQIVRLRDIPGRYHDFINIVLRFMSISLITHCFVVLNNLFGYSQYRFPDESPISL